MRHSKIWPSIIAVGLHGIALFVLLLMTAPQTTQAVPVGNDRAAPIWFALQPLPEGSSLVYMASARMRRLSPTGSDGVPDAEPEPGDTNTLPGGKADQPLSDQQLTDVLAADREALRAELDKMSEVADAKALPSVDRPMPPPRTSGDNGAGQNAPQGAIRELNLDGFPQNVVDDIMQRYGLRVVLQTIKAGHRGQSFLSSAASGGDTYFGGLNVPSGVYEVFQLSRDTVAVMSRLEEEALRKRGFEPLQARIVRIVFGIVENKSGGYELGVTKLEAEKVSP